MEFIDKMYKGECKQTGFMKHYYTLFAIVEGLEAKRTFEFGTGISTKVIVNAVKERNGIHHSVDVRDIRDTGVEPSFYVESADNWHFSQMNSNLFSAEDFATMGPFDFVLHDGSHIPGEVAKDLKKIIPAMKQDSILMVHDTYTDEFKGMDVAVAKALADIDHEMITLPFSNGLTIVRITANLGTGTVKPTWVKNESLR